MHAIATGIPTAEPVSQTSPSGATIWRQAVDYVMFIVVVRFGTPTECGRADA
jgi:hypothetical protein